MGVKTTCAITRATALRVLLERMGHGELVTDEGLSAALETTDTLDPGFRNFHVYASRAAAEALPGAEEWLRWAVEEDDDTAEARPPAGTTVDDRERYEVRVYLANEDRVEVFRHVERELAKAVRDGITIRQHYVPMTEDGRIGSRGSLRWAFATYSAQRAFANAVAPLLAREGWGKLRMETLHYVERSSTFYEAGAFPVPIIRGA